MIFLVYLLGAATSGSLLALLRRSYAASRRTPGGFGVRRHGATGDLS